MAWFDPYFIAISNLFVGGTQQVKERGVNLIAGTNVTITAVDNAAAARTDVTIASTGGSGSVPTGTGFTHITAGAQDGAARAINVASADISSGAPSASGQVLTSTSTSAAAWQAPTGGFTAGGDLTGSSTSQQVQSLTGNTTTGQVNFPAAATGPGFNQPSTSTASGVAMTVAAQTATGGGYSGGALNLSSGGGTTVAGSINLQMGGVTAVGLSASGSMAWGSSFTPTITQTSTTGATGANLTITPQVSTATNGTPGNCVVNIPAPTGTGAPGGLVVTSGGAAASSTGNIRLPANGSIKIRNGANTADLNLAYYDGSNDLYIGDSSATVASVTASSQLNLNFGAGTIEALNSTGDIYYNYSGVSQFVLGYQNQFLNPITGLNSPYGVHGDVTTAITTSTTLSAAQYAMFIIPVAPTAAMTLTLPRAAAGSGYSKLFDVQAAFAVTITDGAHSVTLPAAIGTYEVAFTNAKLMGGTTKL
jgi:hypothetical protein